MGGFAKKAIELTRRDFLSWLTAASLSVTGFFALGTLAKQITPPTRSPEGLTEVGWLAVGTVDSLTEGLPKLVEYGEEWVYLVKKADGLVNAINAACPHVRCKLGWNANTKRFDCPCHGSAFTIDGKRLYGPAPRDMFAMKLRLEGKNIVVGGYADA
ncbi:MAG: Rieske (2Fe-2S) protein [Actinobacteria bacterium]|nr:Rieske (2Fe-2S) protein [Actinomycetota bacterium]